MTLPAAIEHELNRLGVVAPPPPQPIRIYPEPWKPAYPGDECPF